MKKILAVSILLVMSLALLTGCSKAVYKDGTYVAVSDATDKGYMQAEVTVAKDKITAVTFTGFNAIGDEKPAEYPWEAYWTVVNDMPGQMVEKNTWEVDNVAKATGSSTQVKQAVQRAMEMALVEPASTAKYFDGTFMAISEKGAKGWTIAWVTVEGDKITGVDFHSTTGEKNEAGEATGNFVRKGEDYSWQAYHDARAQLPAMIVEKNGFEGIDGFTGATGTFTQLKEAVEAALNSALRK